MSAKKSYNRGNSNGRWQGKDVANASGRSVVCHVCEKEFVPKEWRESRPRKYCSKKCCGIAKEGAGNVNWKGAVAVRGDKHPGFKHNTVCMAALHVYIRRRLPKPEKCECCKEAPPIDLANISQEYKRELTDWEWLCRRCHMTKDGRMNNLQRAPKIVKEKTCPGCGNKFMADKRDLKYCNRECYLKYFKPKPRVSKKVSEVKSLVYDKTN